MTTNTATNKTNAAALVEQLAGNMTAARAKLAAIPEDAYVIVWHDVVLRTDGATVAVLGPRVYHGARWLMERDAEQWNAKASDDEQARAMSRDDALAYIDAQNAALLAAIPGLAT